MPPGWRYDLTLISSNYFCLEHIFGVPKDVRAIEVLLYSVFVGKLFSV